MTTFPERPDDDVGLVYLEETDKPLAQKLNPGTRYAYFKTIARGGKSIIQSCKDLHLGRIVCYKKLKPEFENDEVEQVRFLREARISAMLQHPNTVPTYEVGRDNKGHVYFTMKLVHGYTLREVLDYRERYDLTQLIEVVVQVLHALEFAHSHHVIHRDIKPENVLIGRFGEVLVLDWGLAKVWGNEADPLDEDTDNAVATEPTTITGRGKLQGTIAYMSPEQIRRDPAIDYRTDIFSIGVILYEILAGRPPVVAEKVHEMTEQILEQTPPKPSEITSIRIPPLLEDAAMRCIAKEPQDRFANCGELVRLLQEDWAT